MDEQVRRHLIEQQGLTINNLHTLPIYPPGTNPPSIKVKSSIQNNLSKGTTNVEKLHDFQQMYQKYASGLISMNFPGVVPPGHPLYSRQHSISTLQSENKKLQKENMELKKQLEQVSKKQNHSK